MYTFDVIVVGSGISGLYAAWKLAQKGVRNVCIVEAQEQIGGRVRQALGLAPWALELGPEFIHGARSLLVDVCRDVGMQLREMEWPDFIYWGGEGRLVRGDTDPELRQLNQLMFDALPDEDPPEEDVSVQRWMTARGTPERIQHLADVCYSNDFCCALREMGLTESILESRQWDAGEEYLLKDRSFKHLVDYLAAGRDIRTRWPVARIAWGGGAGASVVSKSGECLSARAVICTVPITQLQNESICFEPAMPAEQLAAIHRVRMGNAVKVFALFRERFWPESSWDVVCTNQPFPELWMTRNPPEDAGHVESTELFCVTGFCTGDFARHMGTLTAAEAVDSLVEQLDRMFGSVSDARPGQRLFVRGYMVDWSKVPYVEGAYTHMSLGARLGDRNLIAASLGGVVFFAGEHTHTAINPCLHGAMETGDRAAAEVFHALEGSRTLSSS